jgi:hypothetical protein
MIAHIVDGVVVNTSVRPDDAVAHAEWVAAVEPTVDSLLDVEVAGIGWELYAPGKVRPPAPSEEATWDEDAQSWILGEEL